MLRALAAAAPCAADVARLRERQDAALARLRAARAALRAPAAEEGTAAEGSPASGRTSAAAATTTTALDAPLAGLEADAREAGALLAALSRDLAAAHKALGVVRARLRERRPDLVEQWRARTREILVAERGEQDDDEEEEEDERGGG